jgi:hypothetical protein
MGATTIPFTADALACIASRAFAHPVLINGSSWTTSLKESWRTEAAPSCWGRVLLIMLILLVLLVLVKMRKIIPLNYRTFFRVKSGLKTTVYSMESRSPSFRVFKNAGDTNRWGGIPNQLGSQYFKYARVNSNAFALYSFIFIFIIVSSNTYI